MTVSNKSRRSGGRDAGWSLTETLAATTIAASILLAGVGEINRQSTDIEGNALAEYHLAFSKAAERYLRENEPNSSFGVQTLKAANYLPQNFSDTSPFGQRPCVRLHTSGITAIVVAEGGKSVPVPVRDRTSAMLGPKSRNFIDAQGKFNDALIASQYPTPCSTNVMQNSPASALSFVKSGPPGINHIHRLPYVDGSNQMNGNLDMQNNDIIKVNLVEAQRITSLSTPKDQIKAISATNITATEISTSATRANQFISILNSGETRVSTVLAANTIAVNAQGTFDTGTINLPKANGGNCTTPNHFAHVDGLPHICKAGRWQPIQFATKIYSTKDFLPNLDRIGLNCGDTSSQGEMIVSAGGSVTEKGASQNLYFEPQGSAREVLLAQKGQLFASNGSPLKNDFYLYPTGAPNPYYQSYSAPGGLPWSTTPPHAINPGLDFLGVSADVYNGDERGYISGTSTFKDGSEAGDSIRATVVCGRMLGLEKKN